MWHILGIKPTNNLREIKKAYSQLVKRYHPEEYPEEFKRIQDAYQWAKTYGIHQVNSELRDDTYVSLEDNIEDFEKSSLDFDYLHTGVHEEERKDTSRETKERTLDFSQIHEENPSFAREATSLEEERRVDFSELKYLSEEDQADGDLKDEREKTRFHFEDIKYVHTSVEENHLSKEEEKRVNPFAHIQLENQVLDSLLFEHWNDVGFWYPWLSHYPLELERVIWAIIDKSEPISEEMYSLLDYFIKEKSLYSGDLLRNRLQQRIYRPNLVEENINPELQATWEMTLKKVLKENLLSRIYMWGYLIYLVIELFWGKERSSGGLTHWGMVFFITLMYLYLITCRSIGIKYSTLKPVTNENFVNYIQITSKIFMIGYALVVFADTWNGLGWIFRVLLLGLEGYFYLTMFFWKAMSDEFERKMTTYRRVISMTLFIFLLIVIGVMMVMKLPAFTIYDLCLYNFLIFIFMIKGISNKESKLCWKFLHFLMGIYLTEMCIYFYLKFGSGLSVQSEYYLFTGIQLIIVILYLSISLLSLGIRLIIKLSKKYQRDNTF